MGKTNIHELLMAIAENQVALLAEAKAIKKLLREEAAKLPKTIKLPEGRQANRAALDEYFIVDPSDLI